MILVFCAFTWILNCLLTRKRKPTSKYISGKNWTAETIERLWTQLFGCRLITRHLYCVDSLVPRFNHVLAVVIPRTTHTFIACYQDSGNQEVMLTILSPTGWCLLFSFHSTIAFPSYIFHLYVYTVVRIHLVPYGMRLVPLIANPPAVLHSNGNIKSY